MITGKYEIGGQVIRINSLYHAVHELCQKYAAEGRARLVIEISQQDIDHEQELSLREAHRDGRGPILYGDAYLETLAVYRKIAEWMPGRDTFLFHGSAIAVDGEGFLFTAGSGTGKSTHTRLWRELLGSKAMMINDDKPLIQVKRDQVLVHGTPWDGKHRLSTNTSVPLRAICILERGTVNRIWPIKRAEAYPMLVQQMYRPSDPEALQKSLMLLNRMKVQFYRLQCNLDPIAARLSYSTMRRKEKDED